MRVIKKIDNYKPIESFKATLKTFPGTGVNVQAKYTSTGELLIMGMDGCDFIKTIPTKGLVLNIHLFNQKKLNKEDYNKIGRIIARLDKAKEIILSSSQLNRKTLEELRMIIWEYQDYLVPFVSVAAAQDIQGDNEFEDMMYSPFNASRTEYENERISHYVNSGIPVIVDWVNNDRQRIANIVEKTNSSEDLIVLSKKPYAMKRSLAKAVS
jgi:hypothetical protein